MIYIHLIVPSFLQFLKHFTQLLLKMLARTLLSKHSSFLRHIYLDVNICAYSYFRAANKPSYFSLFIIFFTAGLQFLPFQVVKNVKMKVCAKFRRDSFIFKHFI